MSLQATAASPDTLRSMLMWWAPGMLIAVGYSYDAYSRMPRTFSDEDSSH